jgi:t-SNARE complex subunit (syntaxin)
MNAERMNAEDRRKNAMENVGETKRKSIESGVKPRKKKRCIGIVILLIILEGKSMRRCWRCKRKSW